MQIKGTKDGVLINLQNEVWEEARKELEEEIKSKQDFFQGARLVLDVGNNILRAKELGELRDLLSAHGMVLSIVLSPSIVTRETAQLLGLKTEIDKPTVKLAGAMKPLDTVLSGEPAVMVHRTMRSGYKIAYQGHVIVLGDVNPGAEVIASGSVVVWGRLRGNVHAGADGDDTAIVCALDLSPMQLRISTKIATTPKDQEKPQPEIASIIDEKIIAEPWKH